MSSIIYDIMLQKFNFLINILRQGDGDDIITSAFSTTLFW